MEQETKEIQKKPTGNPRRMNEPIDLIELCWVFLGKWKLIVALMLLGTLLFGVYHQLMIKPVYQADASVFVTNTNTVITMSDLQLGSALTEDYAKIIKSRAVMKEVIEEQGLNMNFRQLSNLVSVTNPSGSHIITITVTSGDMEMSRNLANAVMEVGIDHIYKVIGSKEPSVIDYAEVEAVQDLTPSLNSYLEKGALAGIILACGLILIQYLMDTTLKTEEEVQRYLRMPVLSVVPYYEEKN